MKHIKKIKRSIACILLCAVIASSTLLYNQSLFLDNLFFNAIGITNMDSVYPVLNHTRVTNVRYGDSIILIAESYDNNTIISIKVFFRATGGSDWNSVNMEPSGNNMYYALIEKSLVSRNGMEYYIEASDGENITRNGSQSVPNKIFVSVTPMIISVVPDSVKLEGGVLGTINGVNFTPDMRLRLNGSELNCSFESETKIVFSIPPGNVGNIDLELYTTNGVSLVRKNAFRYSDSKSEIKFGDMFGKSKHPIYIPITISSEGEIYSFEVKTNTNLGMFTNVSFESSPQYPNAQSEIFTDDSGNITIKMNSQTPLVKNEVAGYLAVTVKDVDSVTQIMFNLISGTLNGGVSAATLTGCDITVVPNYMAAGTVRYYSNNIKIEGVTIRLSSSSFAVTNSEGNYALSGITDKNAVLTPEINGRGNNALTSMDAVLVLQSAAGKASLSSMQKIAADVNGDGMVNAMDASLILQKCVGIKIDGWKDWTFSPSNKSINSAESDTIDFYAILLGDVNGSWKIAENDLE